VLRLFADGTASVARHRGGVPVRAPLRGKRLRVVLPASRAVRRYVAAVWDGVCRSVCVGVSGWCRCV